MTIQDLLGEEVVFPHVFALLADEQSWAERVLGRTQVAVPYLARVFAGIARVVVDETVAPSMDLLDRAMEDLQITEAEAEAMPITAEQWSPSREQVLGAHHESLRALVVAALADGKVTPTERRDLDAAAALLALGPRTVDAFLYEEAETV
jgi:uncharacterized NAD-dependent epimerase/dehydratase family protein